MPTKETKSKKVPVVNGFQGWQWVMLTTTLECATHPNEVRRYPYPLKASAIYGFS